MGLSELGHEVWLITSGEGRIVGEESEKVKTLTKISLSNASNIFSQFDLVIMYTWLSRPFVSWVEEATKSGTNVIIKCDHDGRIGTKARLVHERSKYIISNFWKPRLLYASIKQLVKISAIYSKTMRKMIFSRLVKQVELSKKVLIESPHAAYNLSAVLGHLNRYDLIEKIVAVPNPVAPWFTRNTPQKFDKENMIISVAR